MRTRSIATLAVVLCLAGGSARGSSIGLFFAPDASDCDAMVAPNVPFHVYIVAILGGDPAAVGISGALFRVTGFDPDWMTTVTPNPAANVILGHPFGDFAAIAFPVCQTGPLVPLYTIEVVSSEPIPPTVLRVEREIQSPQPNFLCPQLSLCDAPVFTKLCVAGGAAFLNHPAACTVSVQRATWSRVRSLFD